MLVKYHVISGIILSALIWFVFPSIGFFGFALILLSSFLIDADHYLYSRLEYKTKTIKEAYQTLMKKREQWLKVPSYERTQFKRGVFVFHCIEFWIILALLSLFFKFFLFVLIGVLIHMTLDFIDLKKNKEPLYTKFSLIYLIYKNKGRKTFAKGFNTPAPII